MYCTKNLTYYFNTKDKVLEYLKSHKVMNFAVIINILKKTDQSFVINMLEKQIKMAHKKSAVNNHLLECEHFNNVVNLYSLSHNKNSVKYIKHVEYPVYDKTKTTDMFRKP